MAWFFRGGIAGFGSLDVISKAGPIEEKTNTADGPNSYVVITLRP